MNVQPKHCLFHFATFPSPPPSKTFHLENYYQFENSIPRMIDPKRITPTDHAKQSNWDVYLNGN